MQNPVEWGDEKMAYAGIMKQGRLDNAPAKRDHFIKIKAHVDLKGDLGIRERFLAKGNDWADKEALKAEELHQPPDLHYKEGLEDTTKKVKSILNVLANVLPLWPLSKERHKRTPTAPATVAKTNRLPAEHRDLLVPYDLTPTCIFCCTSLPRYLLNSFKVVAWMLA